jgi:hypothetical protein
MELCGRSPASYGRLSDDREQRSFIMIYPAVLTVLKYTVHGQTHHSNAIQ